MLSWFWWVGVGAQISVRAQLAQDMQLLAQDMQLLASSVLPAPPEAQLALWLGPRQGTLCGAGSPTEERPRCLFSSLWAEGAIPKCMELSRHQREVCGSSGMTDKLGYLTGGCWQFWDRMKPVPRAPAQLHPHRGRLRGLPEPRGAAAWGAHPARAGSVGAGGGMRAGGGSHPLPLCLALLAAVPKLPSLPLRCLLCSSPKAPGPGDLSRLPQLGFGSSNFRHFAVLLSRCSDEEKRLCKEASLALPHHCWLFLCLCSRLAPAWCRLLRDAGEH